MERKFNILESPTKIDDAFEFLIDSYGYSVIQKLEESYTYYVRYEKGDRKVALNYDYKDNFFYFDLINGKNTPYPNDHDDKNIKPFFRLFQKYEPKIDLKKLQPDDNQYLEALELNAQLLRKYGEKVLKGEEWI